MKSKKKKFNSRKTKKKNSHYFLLNNGCEYVIIFKKSTLYLHKFFQKYDSIFDDSNGKLDIKKQKKYIKLKDYINGGYVYADTKVLYQIKNVKEILIGNDIEPTNISITKKNKEFGKGNTILVYNGREYIFIGLGQVLKLNTKGKPICLLSPIGPNLFPYPILITTTHIYSWCDGIDEHKIPNDKNTKYIIELLCKLKNPYQIKNKDKKDINSFLMKYNSCKRTGIKLKKKILFDFS